MKKGLPRLLFALLLTLQMLLPAGCWNRREPQQLGYIITMGFDYLEEADLYEVVVEVANTGVMGMGGDGGGGGGGAAGQQRPFQVFAGTGRTVFEAIRHLEAISPREIFWAHNEVVIFSERLARRGIGAVLEMFTRERLSRVISRPLISGDDLRELLDSELPLEQFTGTGIFNQIQSIERSQSIIPTGDLRLALLKMEQPGRDIFIPRVRLVQRGDGGGQQGGGQGGQQEGGAGGGGRGGARPADIFEISGGAAFRGERMAGWLGAVETRGWFWVTGEALHGTVLFPCPECGAGQVSAEIRQSSSSITPQMRPGGQPAIKVEIKVEGGIQDLDCAHGFARWDRETVVVFNRRLAEAVRREAALSVRRAQEFGSDIFGFGLSFYRRLPREWSALEQNWEEHFRTLPVAIEVKARIRRTGLTIDPLPPPEKERPN